MSVHALLDFHLDAYFRLRCGHGSCLACLEAHFTRRLQEFHDSCTPPDRFDQISLDCARILELYSKNEYTRLPSDVGAALMKGFSWMCIEGPVFTCLTCYSVLTGPPSRSRVIINMANRLQAISGLRTLDAHDQEISATYWDKYFPQDCMTRTLFQYVCSTFDARLWT